MHEPKSYLHLVISFDEFQEKVNELLNEGKTFQTQRIDNEVDLEQFRAHIHEWTAKALAILQNSFSSNVNFFSEAFKSVRESPYRITPEQNAAARKIGVNINAAVQNLKRVQNERANQLTYTIETLTISDVITNNDKDLLNQRQKLKTEEKLALIINKLHVLYGDNFYPIESILFGNGIELRRDNEGREFAEILQGKGLIEISPTGMGISETYVRLTLEGEIYVDSLSENNESYESINKSKDDLEIIIAELRVKLSEVGMGNEILFNELQEIKNLLPTLTKKSWGQLIKGKLVDMVISRAISVEAAKFVYEHITGIPLHIPLLGI